MVNNKFILDSLSSDEGTTAHKDERNILTGPYGVVIQPNTDAYAANQAIAKSLGIETLNKDTSVEDFAKIATKKFELDGIKLTEVYPEYESLNPEFQYVLQDTHFNTGEKYPTLAKRLLEFQNNPTATNKKKVIKESRRTIDGKPSRGLDNRTAKVLARAGIIVSTNEATTNRLKLTTVDLSDVNKYSDYKEIEPVVDSELDADTDVVEPGTTDMLEDVAQQELQEAVDAADRDEQLQQAESLKVQTEKAVPTLPTPKPDVKPTPEPEPEQPSFLERLFGRDEPTQEALDAKKSVLERLGRFKNQPVVSGVPTMNKGGVSIKEQMSMFDDGGLLDEGGTKDPVSGNDVPPGSMQEEVRDDIPAQLSEGEFVFPADVVRYIGLEKLMQLRQEAKMGLKRMEAMGQMGNSDEATIPDDLPFTLDDLELEAEPVEMQLGGFVDPNITLQQSQFGQPPMRPPVGPPVYTPPPPPPSPFVPTQQAPTPVMAAPEVLPTFEQLMPAPEGRYDELVEFENKETGEKMTIPFVNGEPIYPIPSGFTRVETDVVEPTPEPEVVPTAQITSPDDDGDSTNDEIFASSDVTGIGYDKNRLDDSLRSAINQYGFGFGALGETFNIGSNIAREFSKDPKARTSTLTSSAFGGILDAYRGGNVSFSVPGRVGSKTGKYDDNTRLHEMSVQRQRAIAATATSVMSELETIYRNDDGSAKTQAEVSRSQKQLAEELGIDIYVRGTDILKPTNTLMREIAKQKAEIKRQEEAREKQRQEEMRQAAEAAREAKLAKEAEQRRRIEEASRLAVGSEERNRAFGERDDSNDVTGYTEGSIIDTAIKEAIQDVATTADNYQSTGGYFDDYE